MSDLFNGIFPEYWAGIHLPSLVPYIAMVGSFAFVLGILPMLIWIERVVIALMQDRKGPNRVGPRGLLQPPADVLKLFFKEDITPGNVDKWLYYIAPMITVTLAFAGSATLATAVMNFRAENGDVFSLPVSVGDVNVGLLYILGISSLQVYGIILAGWSSNNKYSLLGGLRASAQLISYELSMGLSLLCVVILVGSLKVGSIVEAQNVMPFGIAERPEWWWQMFKGSFLSWFWIGSGLIPVIIYTISMIAETNRAPFDLPEAESELVAGFHTEYSSMKFAMFFSGEYVAMLTVSGLNAAVFWGGSLPPLNILPLTLVPGFIWFIIKIMMGIFLYTWLRATLPRLRYDALMNLGWKRMLPLGLVWLFILAALTLHSEGSKGRDTVPAAPVAEIKAPAVRGTRSARN
ncbi:MAG: NADH-quinone oxidoreductase subunit H [Chthonomonadaceae bacterium]|nr:NADH-quinone oxidoreductase subunit H [Chthonomonadaceae bacterium]